MSFIFDLENLCFHLLNSFLIFSILALEKCVFGYSLSFNDSDSLRTVSSLSSDMLL